MSDPLTIDETWTNAELVQLYETTVHPPQTLELLLPDEWAERKAGAMAKVRAAIYDELAAEWEREAATVWEVGGDQKIFQAFSRKMTDRARRERKDIP